MFRAAWPCSHTVTGDRLNSILAAFSALGSVFYTRRLAIPPTQVCIQQHNAFMVGIMANLMRAQRTEAGLHVPMFVFYVHVVLATREVHVSLNCCAVGFPFVFPRGSITHSAVTSGSPSDCIDEE